MSGASAAERPFAMTIWRIIYSSIAIFWGFAAHAEIRTLPGLTIQVAVTRIGCSVVIDGEELMNGTCHHRLTDKGEVFMTLPEATTQIVVNVSRRSEQGRVVRLWMSSPDGKPRQEILGRLRVQGECQPKGGLTICCHANERVRICSQANPSAFAPSEQELKEVFEKMDRANRELEKLTKQPRR
jgi:hypothetical protein